MLIQVPGLHSYQLQFIDWGNIDGLVLLRYLTGKILMDVIYTMYISNGAT